MISEVVLLASSTTPAGYLPCDGSAVSRTTYADLFAAIGTTYGSGDGTSSFNVPDLRGRIPVGWGQQPGGTAYALGATGGTESVALSVAQMPAHNHSVTADGNFRNADSQIPGDSLLADLQGTYQYSNEGALVSAIRPVTMAPDMIGLTGGGGAHENRQPYLVLAYYIATS